MSVVWHDRDMTFARGTIGLDSAESVNYPTAVATGSRFHFRYTAGSGNASRDTQFKLIKPGEIAAIVAAGSDVIANFELSEDTPTGGAPAGAACGAADLLLLKDGGYAQGASVYISWEPGNDPAYWPQVEAFVRAYDDALGGYYHADGLYAGIPSLKHFGQMGLIKHGWIPESTYASDIPAQFGWIYQPTKDQLEPAMAYLDGLVAGSGLESIVWQNGNKWFAGSADENVVLLGGPLGSHLEALGTTPAPLVLHSDPIAAGPYQGAPWPGVIPAGEYFGNINGPKASHGGFYANEQPFVKMIQQRLIYAGFVPGHSDINDGWADGIFDIQGNGQLGGPTTDAVTRFQHAHMANVTQYWGQVWSDDWATLFSL